MLPKNPSIFPTHHLLTNRTETSSQFAHNHGKFTAKEKIRPQNQNIFSTFSIVSSVLNVSSRFTQKSKKINTKKKEKKSFCPSEWKENFYWKSKEEKKVVKRKSKLNEQKLNIR